jgi:hypothetical protein
MIAFHKLLSGGPLCKFTANPAVGMITIDGNIKLHRLFWIIDFCRSKTPLTPDLSESLNATGDF